MDWIVYALLAFPNTTGKLLSSHLLQYIRIPSDAWVYVDSIRNDVTFFMSLGGNDLYHAIAYSTTTYLIGSLAIAPWLAGWKLKRAITAQQQMDMRTAEVTGYGRELGRLAARRKNS